MKDQRAFGPVVVAALAGAALWFLAAMLSGKREAWDSALYWLLAYPLALITCAYLGYTHPSRPWRWALVVFEAQLIAMCIRNGAFGSLLPLGVLLFAVLALPGIAVAHWAARRGSPSSEEAG